MLLLIVFAAAAPGVLRYGLTWDEPTYSYYAHMQREWVGRAFSDLAHPTRLPALLSQEAIDRAWLQDREKNGHPPLNELWMGMAGLPFHWAGRPDLQSFRLAIAALLSITTMLLYLLLRQGVSRPAALIGAVAFLGIPAVWAHGHIAATEIMQMFFWVLLAILLPWTLERGGRRLWIWFLACALSFMAKFTDLLIPMWLLGTAGVLGAWRMRRFWIAALLAFLAAPAMLLVLDPFFWPWRGGLGRFADYLAQATTRGQWIPIKVFYLGRSWGFHPPWHYRLVQTLAVLPVPLLLLLLPGFYFAARSLWAGARPAGPEGRTTRPACWPQILGLTGFLFALVVGWLPNSPSHDGTREFVYIFVAVALLCGASAEGLLRLLRPWKHVPAVALFLLVAASFTISVLHEPWGLSYYSEWIGGARGAWNKGFELSYWSETITARMLEKLEEIRPREGGSLIVHTLPKLNYFSEGEDCLRALLPPRSCVRRPLARDVSSAFYMPWSVPYRRGNYSAVLGLSFPEAPDAIIVSYRRATVNAGLWEFLDLLASQGELVLLDETTVGGVPLARLYQVPEIVPGHLPQDPEGRTWYQLPSIARAASRVEP